MRGGEWDEIEIHITRGGILYDLDISRGRVGQAFAWIRIPSGSPKLIGTPL